VQVIDEANGQVVYTLRIKGNSFRPKVFKAGKYTVRISEPDTGKTKTLKNVESLPPKKRGTLKVRF